MSAVQRCQFGLVETFNNSKYGSIYETDVGIAIVPAQLANAVVVIWNKILHSIGADSDIV